MKLRIEIDVEVDAKKSDVLNLGRFARLVESGAVYDATVSALGYHFADPNANVTAVRVMVPGD